MLKLERSTDHQRVEKNMSSRRNVSMARKWRTVTRMRLSPCRHSGTPWALSSPFWPRMEMMICVVDFAGVFSCPSASGGIRKGSLHWQDWLEDCLQATRLFGQSPSRPLYCVKNVGRHPMSWCFDDFRWTALPKGIRSEPSRHAKVGKHLSHTLLL